jgi:serine/threonine-protein kinase 24/25/MST4
MKRLDLKDSPLEYSSPPPVTMKKGTVRKQPSIAQLASPTKPRQPSSQRRTPLQPDMSFGNTGSTVRLFRRVSDNSTLAQVNSDVSAQEITRDENRPPVSEPATKETVLGHRVFNKIVDPAFQELHAQTGNQAKREALSRLADAWSALDAIDPERAVTIQDLHPRWNTSSLTTKARTKVGACSKQPTSEVPSPTPVKHDARIRYPREAGQSPRPSNSRYGTHQATCRCPVRPMGRRTSQQMACRLSKPHILASSAHIYISTT